MKYDTGLALQRYLEAFRDFAVDPERPSTAYYAEKGGRVWTEVGAEALRLPSTGYPVRGSDGVHVSPSARVADAQMEQIDRLFGDSITTMTAKGTNASSPGSIALGEALASAFAAFADALRQQRALFRRIYDSRGWKTHSLEELDSNIARLEKSRDDFTFVLFAHDLVVTGLHELGFEAAHPQIFTRWDELAAASERRIDDLADRLINRYSAFAYANGPLCDSADPFIIGEVPTVVDGPLQLRYASDEDLDHAVAGFGYSRRLPPGLHSCNSVLEFDLTVPILGEPKEYLTLYPLAASIAQAVLDVLRIVTGDDIGISHLVLVPRDFSSPSIREDYAWEFHADTAAWRPQRSAYRLSRLVGLREDELSEIRRLLPVHLSAPADKGYDVAIRRLRDACDRYRPEEPERLLDIAIALEAILLNDGDEKELRFRLALRAARLLRQGYPERLTIFETVKQLYDMRSKIAHGVSVSDLKAVERERLARLQTEAPALLRQLLTFILSGSGPKHLRGDELRRWWRSVELA